MHSYYAHGLCQLPAEELSFEESLMDSQLSRGEPGESQSIKEVERPVGVIVNVKTKGRRRIISIES